MYEMTGGVRTVLTRLFVAGAVILFALVGPRTLPAAEEVKVTMVEVQGNRRIEAGTILAKVKTKEGETFSPSQIKDDIKALYQLGHFEDVQVKTEGFENGIKVIFSVREKPLIREVIFVGSDEIGEDELKKDMTVQPRTAFNTQLLYENAEKIRLRFQDRGFYNAAVIPVVTELRGGDRNVAFYIDEGEKIKLSDIIITGNRAFTPEEIKKPLKTQEHWFFSFLGRSGTLRSEELREDLETIRNLYYNKGYIQVQIDEPVIEQKKKTKRTCLVFGPEKTITEKNKYVVRINIREGDQFRVGSVTFKGNQILSEAELRGEMRLAPGDIFSRELLRQDVARIMDRYDGMARPFAAVVPLFDINPDRKTVAVSIDIQEGGEVRIGWIDITGNTKTRDKVIRREMRLDEGDVYSKKALKRSYERMNNLNYFEIVDIAPERRLREPVMDLNVKVKEKLTGTMSIGGGYSSVDGIIGIAEVTQGNLFGRGQVVKVKTQLGGTRRNLVFSFMEPYLFDKPVWGKFDVYSQVQEYDTYWLKSTGIGLSAGKSFGEYISTSLRYGYDSSTLTNVNQILAPDTVKNQLRDYGETMQTSAFTGTVTRDNRDYYMDPKRGSRNSISAEFAGGPLGGDATFTKVVADSGWYFPLFWDTVFMVRGRIGYAGSLSEKPLPVGERFFVGGMNTVRGFEYGAAGPYEPVTATPTDVITFTGGNKELIFNGEYTFPIVPAAHLKGVLFYDIGRAFNDYGDPIRWNKLRHSFGWGFRWLTPMGPLRFEWGYIINQQPMDKPSQFEFSIGTVF